MPPSWTMHHADCLVGMRSIESVDVTITDPPFEKESHAKRRRTTPVRKTVKRTSKYDRELEYRPLSFQPIDERTRLLSALHIARTTRRWALTFCQLEAAMLWRDALEAGGHRYVRTMIWYKPDGQPQFTGDRPSVGYECIVLTHGPTEKLAWNGGGRKGVFKDLESARLALPNVIERAKGWYQKGTNGQVVNLHETTKPLPLMDDLVELFTFPGELVCDLFAGSGQTGIACLRAGRNFLGYEIEERHAELARRRLAGDEVRPDEQQRPLFAVAP